MAHNNNSGQQQPPIQHIPYSQFLFLANAPALQHFPADIALLPLSYPPIIYSQLLNNPLIHPSIPVVLPSNATIVSQNRNALQLQQSAAQSSVLMHHLPQQIQLHQSQYMHQPQLQLQPHQQLQQMHQSQMHSVGGLIGTSYNKEWSEYLLQLAHSKYNSHEYSAALAILQDLFNNNHSHLPTLLLLGCTCYALNLHALSIYYNKLIITIDPQFAEAYSNLGTTYRALAQSKPQEQPQALTQSILPQPQSNVPEDAALNLKLAEHYYKTAISIRPKYWDASVNLAGLLSTQGRWSEALLVYQTIESIIESEFSAEERFDIIDLSIPITAAATSVANLQPVVAPAANSPEADIAFIHRIFETEQRRRKRAAFLRAAGEPVPGESSGFTVERRRDLYFAKGNLLYAAGDLIKSKHEYFKALVAVGVDVFHIFQHHQSNTLPPALISPEQALVLHKQRQQLNDPTHHPTTSSILQTLAKIYQDTHHLPIAIKFYYLSLAIYPTANTCNNLGILLAQSRIDESIRWYELGLAIDPAHVHLYTNLGSALKDRNQIDMGIVCYQRAISIQPDFYIALANLANVFKDLGRVDEAIDLYRRALATKPDFIEAFCNYVNSLLFICDWGSRDQHLSTIRHIVHRQLADGLKSVPYGVPTVLPFHTFTYASLDAWMVREISRRNADRILWNVVMSDWFPGFPSRPRRLLKSASTPPEAMNQLLTRSLQYPYPYPITHDDNDDFNIIRIGYISSDFTNHPLSHLMQSVFSFHNRQRFRVYCYALTPSDGSPYRTKIESDADTFVDVSGWSTQQIVYQISQVDRIHVLCNLNGYTKGGRNEVFAARPALVQVSLMGFAGTMGAGRVNDPVHGDAVPKLSSVDVQSGYIDDDDEHDGDVDDDLEFFDGMRDRWIDYFIVDEIACPRQYVCGEPVTDAVTSTTNTSSSVSSLSGSSGSSNSGDGVEDNLDEDNDGVYDDDRNRVYTESMVYMPHSFFVNDHRQGFREQEDEDIDRIVAENETQARNGHDQHNHVVSGANAQEASIMVPFDATESTLPLADVPEWRKEQLRRLKMRRELFPTIPENTIIYANFNQLYKMDPNIFATWMNILKRVPNSILWLLRFPPSGEAHLRRRAIELVGLEVSRRLIFTDVAPKHMHIHRGRIADVFLDTPECNAHTTAADILWSGTPVITYPKYGFKMCSRVAASVAYATGEWVQQDAEYVDPVSLKSSSLLGGDRYDGQGRPQGIQLDLGRLQNPNLLGHYMVVNSYQEYEDRAVMMGKSVKWGWMPISPTSAQTKHDGGVPSGLREMAKVWDGVDVNVMMDQAMQHVQVPVTNALAHAQHNGINGATVTELQTQPMPLPVYPTMYPDTTHPTHIFVPYGLAIELRRRLFLTRDTMPLFDTPRWVRCMESGIDLVMEKWQRGYDKLKYRNATEVDMVRTRLIGTHRGNTNDGRRGPSRSASTTSATISTTSSVVARASRCLWAKDVE